MPTKTLQSHVAAACIAGVATLTLAVTPFTVAAQPSPRPAPSSARPPAPPAGEVKPAAVELPAEVKAACQRIHADEIIATIRFLASPRLEGRDAGERGAEVAADYLVSRFQAAGLRAGSKDGYLQRFDLVRRTLAPEEELTLTRRSGSATSSRPLALRTDWVPLSFSEIGSVEAPVVFAGYGIVAPEYKWDDYAALGANGAKGKVVVVLRHEPDEDGKSGSKFFEGREMTLHASLRQKARVAAARGAVALLVVDDPLLHEVQSNPSNSLGGWTYLTAEERKLPKDDPARPRGTASVDGLNQPLGVLAAHASQELLRWLDAGRDWKALQRDLDAGRRSKAFAVPAVTVRFVHAVEVERQPTSNVLAILPGSDPELAKEYVLVGGHYDHVGKDRRTAEIHPGADDNASGTAAVVAIAEAFASLSPAPARSLLFVGWGAEEKGLLGSAYFVRKPAVPLDKIVAGINLDMLGRNKEGEMSVVGRTETPELTALFDRFASEVGFALNDDAGAGASRSDNGSLWLGGIPTASLFSGTHEDYHEPGDTADKVLPGKVEKAARLAFLVSAEVASGRSTPAPLDVPAGAWKAIAPKRETKPVVTPEARAADASAAQGTSAGADAAAGAAAKAGAAGNTGAQSASPEAPTPDAAPADGSVAPHGKPNSEKKEGGQ
ncbi:MAG TPA: M28 family peptidase [Candidatus Krumholzibacteria bacterium]|nr:M28 family peptidase [Candidatus Krumholzibacteria bacterium]